MLFRLMLSDIGTETLSTKENPFEILLANCVPLRDELLNIMALVIDTSHYPSGSLFSDCQGIELPQLVAMASIRSMWRAKVASL